MILLDDNTPTLLVAAGTQNAAPPILQDEFGQTILKQDSITRTMADSLKSMDLTDLKDVVTGRNTIVQDGLHALTELTVSFIPKLLIAILILWVGMKLAKMLRKLIVRTLDKRNAEPSL